MANRTVAIKGYGFGSSPAEITVTANGTQIFTGAIPTLDQPVPPLPDYSLDGDTVDLFTFDIPQTFNGNIPMTCTVNSGIVLFAQAVYNYALVPNPVYTPSDWEVFYNPSTTRAQMISVMANRANPPLSEADITLLESTDPLDQPAQKLVMIQHNITLNVIGSATDWVLTNGSNDSRINVTLDGVAQNPDHTADPGTWWWRVNSGQVFAYDLGVLVPEIE